jgi:hypothetical protein
VHSKLNVADVHTRPLPIDLLEGTLTFKGDSYYLHLQLND